MRAFVHFTAIVMLAGCSSDSSVNDASTNTNNAPTEAGQDSATDQAEDQAGRDLSRDQLGRDQLGRDQSNKDQSNKDQSNKDQSSDLVADLSADMGTICQQLIADFATLLAEVKQCNPYTAMNECTLKIPDSLDCPCDTYVNSGKASKVQQMESLDQQWKSNNCVSAGCPPVPCPQPTAGACQEQPGNVGVCQDVLP